MSESREIELKLTGDTKTLQAALRSSALNPWVVRIDRAKTLDNRYFDTADLRLAQNGVALRVRKLSARRYVQTLKAAAIDDGPFVRGEWELPIPGPALELDRFIDAEARARIGLVKPDELAERFKTVFKRKTMQLADPDGAGMVELALDIGAITAEDGDGRIREEAIAEIELELKSGSPHVLFDLADKLATQTGLSIAIGNKAERGHRLATGQPPEPQKAARSPITTDMTVEQALEHFGRHGYSQWLANQPVVEEGSDPEGAHQMRVALRRLRSALTLFRRVIPPIQLERLKSDMAWLASALGIARDWDVFVHEIIGPAAGAILDQDAVAALIAQSNAHRLAGYDTARAALRDPRYTRLVLAMGDWIEGQRWREQPYSPEAATLEQPVLEFANRSLSRRYRQVRRLGRGFQSLNTESRHAVRIALKKLRYAADFFRPLYPKKQSAVFIRHLQILQSDLGYLNDVATANRIVTELTTSPGLTDGVTLATTAGQVIGWHQHGLAAAEPKVCKDWAAFVSAKPFWTSVKPRRNRQSASTPSSHHAK